MMNFLLRSAHHASPDLPTVPEVQIHKDEHPMLKRAITLEGLIAEDPFPTSDDGDRDSDLIGDASGAPTDLDSQNQIFMGNHSDVAEDEGWITIPQSELPDGWSDASDILELRSLDRSFVFPGEQIHLLVCLSASKQETEIITPFKIAAVISKNSVHAKKQPQSGVQKSDSISDRDNFNGDSEETAVRITEENGGTMSMADGPSQQEDISATESLLRMEDHKNQTEALLEKFRNSHFFVRIAESDEPLWSKRNAADPSLDNSEIAGGYSHSKNVEYRKIQRSNLLTAAIDRGSFDGNSSGGVARNAIKCYSLRNRDIVVLLQVNVAICSNIKDPVLEVLQFEKHESANNSSEHLSGLHQNYKDPCHELLNWLLPLDRTLPSRPLSPPLSSSSVVGMTQRSTSISSSSQIFSFGHLRSYSMPSLPQVSIPPSPAIPMSYSRPSFDLEDYGRLSHEKVVTRDMGKNVLLSFRGVPLEPERFSVHCGLEGIYLPRRRWRRKLEIIQPLEIHSFAAECTTEDLLCVQVKNVTPAHLPDIVIFLDGIAIIFEEASKDGRPLSLPIASIETGNGHNLPNLSLRRGEEHSFILKPATTVTKDSKSVGERKPVQSNQRLSLSTPKAIDGKKDPQNPSADQYAVLVSCHCNYTESKLFFKQPTSWRPRIARDLMISVVSNVSEQTVGPNGRIPQLPVQVLTLQASNLTSEDVTLTVLAPVATNPSPSVMPLSSAPLTPKSPVSDHSEVTGRAGGLQRFSSMPVSVSAESQKKTNESGKRSISITQHTGAASDVTLSSDLGCTHLWLQSTVPLGCVPAGSSATVKLELLPLTDGIITLSTLEVAVKEKGVRYKPEQPLKIHATSSISTGIV